jgi:hypothetical protein
MSESESADPSVISLATTTVQETMSSTAPTGSGSMSHPDGQPIEYTSLSHASLTMWTIDNAKNGKRSKLSQQPNELLSMVGEFECMISENISNFVHNSTSHFVQLQPGALSKINARHSSTAYLTVTSLGIIGT